jgi:hypothetical protein
MEVPMSLEGHFIELQRRHEALEKEIEKEQSRPASDEQKVTALKRKKLQLKDEMRKLRESETLH